MVQQGHRKQVPGRPWAAQVSHDAVNRVVGHARIAAPIVHRPDGPGAMVGERARRTAEPAAYFNDVLAGLRALGQKGEFGAVHPSGNIESLRQIHGTHTLTSATPEVPAVSQHIPRSTTRSTPPRAAATTRTRGADSPARPTPRAARPPPERGWRGWRTAPQSANNAPLRRSHPAPPDETCHEHHAQPHPQGKRRRIARPRPG